MDVCIPEFSAASQSLLGRGADLGPASRGGGARRVMKAGRMTPWAWELDGVILLDPILSPSLSYFTLEMGILVSSQGTPDMNAGCFNLFLFVLISRVLVTFTSFGRPRSRRLESSA